jgi:hypothetical protein
LKSLAEQWAGQGDVDNYRAVATKSGHQAISYESPVPFDAQQQLRFDEAEAFLHASNVLAWATQSLEQNILQPHMKLASAVAFAKQQDSDDMFKVRFDVEIMRYKAQSPASLRVSSVLVRMRVMILTGPGK